ncbi:MULTISPECIES: hypothetical protein [Thermodesulfovibrio]|jgi:superoxide reductase|uniref:hypothetical protein n=1 Tax=Thermodesulfovibrio TaxID=28261 RepID=UPI002606AC63|nr:hypothetical protein [Thermodesulfovibrio sp.]
MKIFTLTVAHFILRHTLVDENGNTLSNKIFTPKDLKAKSTYKLPQRYKGKIYATSFYNLHDLWVSEYAMK